MLAAYDAKPSRYPGVCARPRVGQIGDWWFGEQRNHVDSGALPDTDVCRPVGVCGLISTLLSVFPSKHYPALMTFGMWPWYHIHSHGQSLFERHFERLQMRQHAVQTVIWVCGCVGVCVLLPLCCIFHWGGGQCVPRHCKLVSGDCLPESPAIQFAAGISFRRKPVSACYAFYHLFHKRCTVLLQLYHSLCISYISIQCCPPPHTHTENYYYCLTHGVIAGWWWWCWWCFFSFFQ